MLQRPRLDQRRVGLLEHLFLLGHEQPRVDGEVDGCLGLIKGVVGLLQCIVHRLRLLADL